MLGRVAAASIRARLLAWGSMREWAELATNGIEALAVVIIVASIIFSSLRFTLQLLGESMIRTGHIRNCSAVHSWCRLSSWLRQILSVRFCWISHPEVSECSARWL